MYVYYFASESHRQRCIADGAIKETDWTPALQRARADKAIDHVPGWHSTSCAARGVANIQQILRVAPDQMPHPPNPLAAAATTLWHGRAGAAREIACFKRFRQPLFHQRKYLSDYIWTIYFITALSIVLHREHRNKINVGYFKVERCTEKYWTNVDYILRVH